MMRGLIKVVEWEDMELTSTNKHLKNTSAMEEFSWKTNWKLINLCTAKAIRQIHT